MNAITHMAAAVLLLGHIALAAAAEPTLETVPQSGTARVDDPFLIECTVRWSGPAEAFLFLPPELSPIESAQWRVLSSRASARSDGNTYAFTVEIIPTGVGEFELPGISVPYVPGGAGVQSMEEDVTQVLRGDPIPLVVRGEAAGAGRLLIPLAAVLLVVLCVLVYILRRSAKRPDEGGEGQSSSQIIQAAMHHAQRHRLDGDFYNYYRELTRVAEIVASDEESARLAARLKKWTQDVGYRKVLPTEDELNGDQREVERAVGRWKENMES